MLLSPKKTLAFHCRFHAQVPRVSSAPNYTMQIFSFALALSPVMNFMTASWAKPDVDGLPLAAPVSFLLLLLLRLAMALTGRLLQELPAPYDIPAAPAPPCAPW